ncbi:MAG: hypothetical protein AAGI09_11900 [Pseudomonadota bacterium]
MSLRKTYRKAVRDAFDAAPEFAGYAFKRVWVRGVSSSDLPAWTVLTPDEDISSTAKHLERRTSEVTVILKRAGGEDLDDVLDDDAELIERVMAEALGALDILDAQATRIRPEMTGEGGETIGQVAVSFTCTAITARA